MTASTELTPPGLRRFNARSASEAQLMLLSCCASTTWAAAVAAGRPYASLDDLLTAAAAACRDLTDADLAEALSAHPRIGDRAQGARVEARWSRAEQASVADSDAAIREELRAGQAAYEEKFGRVFLIRAAGRSPEEMLTDLHRRLDNDPDTERREVAAQLCEITQLRVERLLAA